MLLDGLASSHPVSQEVLRATDIDRVFDWIAYKKALKRNGKYVNIQEVMDQWTLQMGYPVITILGNMTAENRIIITQQHFIYETSAKTKALQLQNNRAGYLPQNIPLEIIRYLSEEKDFLPWHAASRALYPLDKLLDRMENYNVFNEYVLKQVATTYIKLGWPKNNFNGSLVQASYQHEELRREVIMLACSFGNKHCHQQASTLISDWISSNRNRIPLNVRDIVYCTGVSLLDEDVWEFIWMKFHSTTAVSEKKILLEALTCSDDRNLLNLLNLSLNSEVVLDQDAIDVIIHVARNPHGRDLAWKFFRDKWKILNTRYGEALFMNSKLISGVTEFLNTEGELKELKNFMKTYDGVASASFSRAVETVEANVRWKRLYQDELFQWLGKAMRH
ncbi:Thyrotropin-releasing hormone-degrading ectoenzyme [Microtus ochrogaster]|uniref:Thyrotropin-releasing hormone-degrading ectoenzyme n=1 Tax=Microtus ochrogaster TaxID=79684 RepID=A0A8J6G031_MICOH|nr:Thyrotropin-releasing hormone-degrading ectoenzyme [Microtus ochrogaster]